MQSPHKFLVHLTKLNGYVKNIVADSYVSPLSSKHMNRFYDAFHETGRGLLIGVGLTCVVQGLVAAIAYLCLQIPRWYALGVLTGTLFINSNSWYSNCLDSNNNWSFYSTSLYKSSYYDNCWSFSYWIN